jgi:parallel beta-helix repeat protein
VQELNDGAGIFIRDSNIVIKNNLIHDVFSYGTGTPGWGIYLGCETRYTQVMNNVVYGTTEGMHIWYATRNVTVENNIFVDCEVRQIRYETTQNKDLTNNRFIRNIVYVTRPYAEVFSVQGENTLPLESDYNVLFYSGGKTPIIKNMAKGEVNSFEDWLKRGYEKNSIIADPLFKDPENHDYTLLPDSPALKLGFKQIDLSSVGLRGSGK